MDFRSWQRRAGRLGSNVARLDACGPGSGIFGACDLALCEISAAKASRPVASGALAEIDGYISPITLGWLRLMVRNTQMASSYLDYCSKTARINDQILTIVALLIADEVQTHPTTGPEASLVTEWAVASLNSPPGLIEFDLSGFWETDTGRIALTSILEAVKTKTSAFGKRIPASILTTLANSQEIQFVDTDVSLVLSAIDKWKAILEVND
jgi:hypothetical protein